jgi:hypothetical protein
MLPAALSETGIVTPEAYQGRPQAVVTPCHLVVIRVSSKGMRDPARP